MGRKKTRGRGRLSGIAAGLAATAAALIPGVATASAAPATEATEAAARTTPPERLLELANSHPDQVLANRADPSLILGPAGLSVRGHEFHYSTVDPVPDRVERTWRLRRSDGATRIEGY